jgi:hypothetical protein
LIESYLNRLLFTPAQQHVSVLSEVCVITAANLYHRVLAATYMSDMPRGFKQPGNACGICSSGSACYHSVHVKTVAMHMHPYKHT